MKCRACWADKAYVREVAGWRGVALSWVGLVPLKCHHCYHRFVTLRLLTLGQTLTPPVRKASSPAPQLSVIAAHEGRDENLAVVADAAPRRKAA